MTTCARCDTELAPALLSCPSCHALVHAEQLKQLASEAESAENAGALKPAMEKWRAALELLPSDSEQSKTIEARVADLMRRATPSKAKMLILGLGERRTVVSAFVSFLFYIGLFGGWQVALGIIVCIYIHEMGHVYVLQQLGLPASPPIFIPGLGALVTLKQSPSTPHADARVGLAGPVWGLGAALATYGLYLVTKVPVWGVIAQFTALMNLFNLTPIWQLDGSRGFHALSREERWLVVIVIGIVFWLTQQRIILLPGVIAIWRAFEKNAPTERDPSTLGTFIILLAALGWLSSIPFGYHF
ncbi:MAG TPA: site-2 protease family protein [Gemmatimonadaceae bacterium]|nr:site-2 protease family protein [Gemmatimonadaceae bacterium]